MKTNPAIEDISPSSSLKDYKGIFPLTFVACTS